MTLSHKDLNAIQTLFSPIEDRLLSLENQVKNHLNMTDGHFDALFKSSETFRHEYLNGARTARPPVEASVDRFVDHCELRLKTDD